MALVHLDVEGYVDGLAWFQDVGGGDVAVAVGVGSHAQLAAGGG